MIVAEIIEHIGLIKSYNLDADLVINNVAFDSRKVCAGDLFVAISGTHLSGDTFIAEAVANGATIIVTKLDINIPNVLVLVVADTKKALAALSDKFFDSPSKKMKVIGITGTNGKTTIAYLVKHILEKSGHKVGIIGTIEYVFGNYKEEATRTTPDVWKINSLLSRMLASGCDCVVMEVSSHALEQDRVCNIDFDVVAFSNLTPEHLDYHHTMEDYLSAKLKLFKQLNDSGDSSKISVINADDSYASYFLKIRDNSLLYSLENNADVCLKKINKLTRRSALLTINTINGALEISTSLVGRHNVSNILAAVTIAVGMNISLSQIEAGIGSVTSVCGRCEFLNVEQVFDVVIDYAHTDDALRKILETVISLNYKRIILVFGCGGDRDSGKRPLMGKVAVSLADYVILTADNSRYEETSAIIEDIKKGMRDKNNFEVILDRTSAIEKAISLATENDCVLVAGKGHEKTQEINGQIILLDDKEIVKEFIKKKKR